MAIILKAGLLSLKLISIVCLLPMLPALGLMWFAKWATPTETLSNSANTRPEKRAEMEMPIPNLCLTSNEVCPACGQRMSDRRRAVRLPYLRRAR